MARISHNRKKIPWLVMVAALAFGPLLGGCVTVSVVTPTPTKTPAPSDTAPAPDTAAVGVAAAVAATAALTVTQQPQAAVAAPTQAAVAAPTTVPTTTQASTASLTPSTTPTPPLPGPANASDGMTSPDFGAEAFLWWRPEVADRDLGLMKDAGFRWVKQLVSWQDVEGAGQGKFDWSDTDRVVTQVQKYGLKLIVRLSADPDQPFWAGTPPASSTAFAAFAGAVAQRYAGRIQAYQVWNEPNLAREWGNKRPDPTAYAQLLHGAYSAIKAADPQAIVVSAGMAPTTEDDNVAMPDLKFYQGMYDAMGRNSAGYFDMLGAHAAGYAVAPETDPQVVVNDPKLHNNDPSSPNLLRVYAFRHLEDVRALMVQNGDAAKRVVVLEFGWTTDDRPNSPYYWYGAGAGIDEMKKGDYLIRAYQYAAAHWQPWIALMTLIYMPDVNWTKNDEQYYWSILGPGYPDAFWRPGYIAVCIYFNGTLGQRCKYDPNQH
jgi:hypothetical protein